MKGDGSGGSDGSVKGPLYEVRVCVDTGLPALYMRVEATHPGAMEGWVLVAHRKDFLDLLHALAVHFGGV